MYIYIDVFFKYVKLLDRDLKDSLNFYTSDNFKKINKKSNLINNEVKNHIDNILTAFDGSPALKNSL